MNATKQLGVNRLPSTLVFHGASGGDRNVPPNNNGPIDVEWAEVVPEETVPTKSNAGRIIGALWNIGNYWLRVAILIVAFWPIFAAFAALSGSPTFTAVVTMLPLVAGVLILLLAFDPLFLVALGTFGLGRKVLATLAMIVGTELAMGVFLSLVPFGKDPGLIFPALLVMMAIIFFLLSGVKGKIVSVLGAILVVIAVTMFMGGREEVARKVASTTNSTAGSVSGYVLDVGPRDEKEIKIPILQWILLEPDKNIIIRRPDGESFMETPGRKLYRFNKETGKYDMAVSSFGNNVSKIYVRSTADVARIEVSFMRM